MRLLSPVIDHRDVKLHQSVINLYFSCLHATEIYSDTVEIH